MWNDDNANEDELNKKIAQFADSVMSGSSLEMNCENCPVFNFNCEECLAGKVLVEKYQSHKHTFSCKKKNKVCRILPTEGHGRLDYKIEGEELLAPVCRLRHPKYPIDETEFVRGFPEDTNEDELKQAKKDYKKIRKYLLRLTHAEDFKESDRWKSFIKLTFNEFLYEIGMVKDGKDANDMEALKEAKTRYINALRCEVKSSGMVILKRTPWLRCSF